MKTNENGRKNPPSFLLPIFFYRGRERYSRKPLRVIRLHENVLKRTDMQQKQTEYAILYHHSTNYNIKSLGHYKSQLQKFKSWHENICFLKINSLCKATLFSSTFSIMNLKLMDT
jgi:hypothetical protein